MENRECSHSEGEDSIPFQDEGGQNETKGGEDVNLFASLLLLRIKKLMGLSNHLKSFDSKS